MACFNRPVSTYMACIECVELELEKEWCNVVHCDYSLLLLSGGLEKTIQHLFRNRWWDFVPT